MHTETYVVPQGIQIDPNEVIYPPSCYGYANGSISIDITGGTGLFSYYWLNGTGSADSLYGLVDGIYTLVVDDIVDTAGTLTQAASALVEKGASRVYACCTHPVLSGPASDRINDSVLEELVTTDTIPLPSKLKDSGKVKVLTIGELLAEAITRIHEDSSVSSLFI